MIHNHLNLNSPALRRSVLRVIRWTTIDPVLGMVCGAIFGGVFGGIGILVHFEPSPIVSIAEYFALCGGGAGALVGICSAFLEDAEAPEPEYSSPSLVMPQNRIDPLRDVVGRGNRRRHNRLPPASETPRQSRESMASRNPSL